MVTALGILTAFALVPYSKLGIEVIVLSAEEAYKIAKEKLAKATAKKEEACDL